MDIFDCVVVGAGPAGLFTAINVALKGKKVLVIEKKTSPGKKFLISGSGQCNLTNSGNTKDFFTNYFEKKNFAEKIIKRFSPDRLMDFFSERGIDFIKSDNGKVFPRSKRASDLLSILLNELREADVKIIYDSKVESIKKEQDLFNIRTKEIFSSRSVVITTGGKSYPITGSEGDVFRICEDLKIRIKKMIPALTPVYINKNIFKDLTGVSVNAKLTVKNPEAKYTFSGSLLFTHKGLSGPCVLKASRYIEKDSRIFISFTNNKRERMENILLSWIDENGKRSINKLSDLLNIPVRLTEKLLSVSDIKKDLKASELNKKDRKRLLENLCCMEIIDFKKGGFQVAMVTRGGIPTEDIFTSTLMHKEYAGLFFAGEVLDVDADTGGYNLQFAFSSAYIAAEGVCEFLD